MADDQQIDQQIYQQKIDDGLDIVSLPFKKIIFYNKKKNQFKFKFKAQSFPTPMEEPKKVLKAQYLGSHEVTQPNGIEVLNDAIDKYMEEIKPENWENVNVSVAPSMISIHTTGVSFNFFYNFFFSNYVFMDFIDIQEEGRLLAECRVRYLSFLGIGKNVKNCAFIMHTAQDKFIAHIFHCEPSSGALCKTIEAACKVWDFNYILKLT